mgnify:CR=1 FL=1
MKYLINEDLLEKVEKKLMSIKRKCEKYGNDFVYAVDKDHPEFVQDKESGEVLYKFYPVEVEGIAKINNYELVAMAEPHESGNVIKIMKEGAVVPERFRSTGCICEHCNISRARKAMLIVHNTETDEYKQVGKSCLNLYTGGINAEAVASWYDELRELEEENGRWGEYPTRYYNIEDILYYAIPIIKKIGYYNSESQLPTKSLVSTMFWHRKTFAEKIRELNKELVRMNCTNLFDKKDFDVTPELEKEVQAIIKYYTELEPKSDFVKNVQILLNDGAVKGNNFGFICYLPEGYRRAMEKEKERKAREAQRAKEKAVHYGTEKTRYKGIDYIGIYHMTSYYTDFGETYVYKIVLSGGELLTWKTQKWLYDDKGNLSVKENGKVDFTVKEHSEYKGKPQTIVTRGVVK